MLRLMIGSAVAALAMSGAARAAPAPLAADAAMFGARETAGQVALSPSGNKVVMLVAGPGQIDPGPVFDLQTGAMSTALVTKANPQSLDWCKFATDVPAGLPI